MKTYKHSPITNSVIFGKAPDGSPLRTWSEGDRTFTEAYIYFDAISGTTYGTVVVIETTLETA